MTLLEQIQKEHAAAFTHGGKFHADDVFSAALLLHFNPQLTIQRGNRVPEDFDGIVFDIGRGVREGMVGGRDRACRASLVLIRGLG